MKVIPYGGYRYIYYETKNETAKVKGIAFGVRISPYRSFGDPKRIEITYLSIPPLSHEYVKNEIKKRNPEIKRVIFEKLDQNFSVGLTPKANRDR